jgi:hypothetical protein
MATTEVHVEQLLGRKVRDVDGRPVGRVEELHVDVVDGESVVTEYHLGSAALVERIAGFARQLPFFRMLPVVRSEYRVRWNDLDLSDPHHPRLRVPRSALRRGPIEGPA